MDENDLAPLPTIRTKRKAIGSLPLLGVNVVSGNVLSIAWNLDLGQDPPAQIKE